MFECIDAITSVRNYFNRPNYGKLLKVETIREFAIAEFLDENNEICYLSFNEKGKTNNVVYHDFDSCVIAMLLRLTMNDSKILSMIMSVKKG